MAAKNRAARAGAGAVAAGKAARNNEYIQRLLEDEDLRDNLRTAFTSARKAFDRISGKGPAKALIDDKKTRRELKETASSLREAAEALRGAKVKRKRRRRGGLLLLLVAGAGVALAVNEDLRNKVLDLVFGAEEEFEYTATSDGSGAASGSDAGSAAGTPEGAPPAGPVGTS